MKQQMSIYGMSCKSCVSLIKDVLNDMDGVTNIKIDLELKELVFELDETKNDVESVANVINSLGFKATYNK